ncbi:MAG: methyltransferase domain-containing protein [Gemmatimonadaceae bacterium]|nr:methyltransferase domain-containing protein [Gemmatimonadaceae bacterium]MDQ3518622.1 methyltransferase domain-containing protein [Gemmatimonadota bacterium]
MQTLLTPKRRRGVEFLDEPGVDSHTIKRSMQDVALSNSLFGGTRAVLAELHEALISAGTTLTLLDVGTGAGDIPECARAAAQRRGVTLQAFAVEACEPLAHAASARGLPTACADARNLPLKDRSVDIVICSQLLHHFEQDEGMLLLREMNRVARRLVVVGDLRRSWMAAGGIWLASWLLRFHPVSRHDGVVSVLRGFTPGELHDLIASATGAAPSVRRRAGFRVSASWRPARTE